MQVRRPALRLRISQLMRFYAIANDCNGSAADVRAQLAVEEPHSIAVRLLCILSQRYAGSPEAKSNVKQHQTACRRLERGTAVLLGWGPNSISTRCCAAAGNAFWPRLTGQRDARVVRFEYLPRLHQGFLRTASKRKRHIMSWKLISAGGHASRNARFRLVAPGHTRLQRRLRATSLKRARLTRHGFILDPEQAIG